MSGEQRGGSGGKTSLRRGKTAREERKPVFGEWNIEQFSVA